MRALLLLLVTTTPTFALTVNEDGTISCDRGKETVFWQEYTGGPETDLYQGIISFDHEALQYREILFYKPWEKKSEILSEITAGIGIPWRAIDGLGPYRFLEVTTNVESDYKGRPVSVLLLDITIHWPVCAYTKTVSEWFDAATKPN